MDHGNPGGAGVPVRAVTSRRQRKGEEPGSYAEIELRWPHGSGGIIIRRWDRPAPAWLYVVTTDPGRLYQRAKATGLDITRELQGTHYGNRMFTAADPWAVTWTFGTYPGS